MRLDGVAPSITIGTGGDNDDLWNALVLLLVKVGNAKALTERDCVCICSIVRTNTKSMMVPTLMRPDRAVNIDMDMDMDVDVDMSMCEY